MVHLENQPTELQIALKLPILQQAMRLSLERGGIAISPFGAR
jgi:hypothetical protein